MNSRQTAGCVAHHRLVIWQAAHGCWVHRDGGLCAVKVTAADALASRGDVAVAAGKVWVLPPAPAEVAAGG